MVWELELELKYAILCVSQIFLSDWFDMFDLIWMYHIPLEA